MAKVSDWKVLGSYFEQNPYFISKHHLDSYNEFISKYIPMTIASMNPFPIVKNDDATNLKKHEIEVYIGGVNSDKLYFTKPVIYESSEARLLYPNEARLKNWTYACELRADMTIKYTTYKAGKVIGVQEKEIKNVLLSHIPIMLHSKLCILSNQPATVLREMGECPYDQGGYFVVDGKEKVIVAQERIVTNRLFIEPSSDVKYTYRAFIRCTSEKNSVFPKTIYLNVLSKDFAKVLDNKQSKLHVGKRKDAITIQVPHINHEIPLCVLFRALGIESDLDILSTITGNVDDIENQSLVEFLRASIVDGNFLYTQDQALAYLANYVGFGNVNNVRYVIVQNLFPNVETDFVAKATFLGYIVKQLVRTAIGLMPPTDRDNYVHKRVGISGFLLADIFKDFYNHFRVQTRTRIDNIYNFSGGKNKDIDISTLITELNKEDVFGRSENCRFGLIKSLKGNWGLSNDSSKQGIVQDLGRISYLGFISHLRRVNTPMDTSVKIRAPHQLNGSQWGIMCPCESPDGASIGLLKNLALMTHITFSVASDIFRDADSGILNPAPDTNIFGVYMLSDPNANVANGKVLVNNNWIATVESPHNLVEFLRLMRRNSFINPFISISWNILRNEISINTDNGRCCRPLYVVMDNRVVADEMSTADWNTLMCGRTLKPGDFDMYLQGFKNPFTMLKTNDLDKVLVFLRKNVCAIEFVDVEELNNSMVAMSRDDLASHTQQQTNKTMYTHCEIHPSTIFSVYTCTIPLSNHNQAPRNIFSGAQGKQAIGVYATNFNNRIDTMSYVLHYPQRAIVNTRYMEYLHANTLTNGENVIVAICTYTGYNQEDSIIINQSSIDRGLFNLTYFKAYTSEEKVITERQGGTRVEERETFANPNKLIADNMDIEIKTFANYTKLEDNGLPKLNEYIAEGDAIIGKCRTKTKYERKGDDKNDFFIQVDKKESFESACEIADKTVSGFVDKAVMFKNKDGVKEAKVRLRKIRFPELGDKLSSRHGQKGVVGLILSQEEMPFTADGLVPDIIVNPHAFPSRMTIGHLLECILAKGGTRAGYCVDGTAFERQDVNPVMDLLESKYKMNRHGDEIMYNGITGEQMQCEVFIGPTYYYRLKHMVADKINYRLQGKVVGLTQQPTKGRGNNGGLRIGEMESNVIVSHGMSAFLKESMMERSDKTSVYVGDQGQLIAYNERRRRVVDDGVKNYKKVYMPHSFKLLTQELITMNIKPILSNNDDGIDNDLCECDDGLFEDFDNDIDDNNENDGLQMFDEQEY
jgi:DNA-directed RNA polymerase II subunit RPB2